MTYQFEYKSFFWLLIAIPVLVFLFLLLLRWKKKTLHNIGDTPLVNKLIQNFSPRLFTSKFILLSLAFGAGVVTLTNFRKPGDANSIMRKGIDIVIALDVSKSMLAADPEPSRLERAKQLVIKLMDELPDDRIGLVLFAGRAYLQMPLTTDHGAARLFVNAAAPDAIPLQGTVISEALEMSNKAFNPKERHFKSIILISDGEDHDINALTKAEELAELGVMINTVGIGSSAGSSITDPATGEQKKDASGNIIISKLNETELKKIAQKTSGVYVHLQSSDEAINQILNQLSQIDKKAYGDVSLMNFKTYYFWFAGLMFLLLLIEILIPETKQNRNEAKT